MQTRLRDSSYREVRRFKALGSKERVSISDTKNTLWFMIEVEGEPAGCCGLYLTMTKARMKGDYVLPQYRGLGLGTLSSDFRIEKARELGYSLIETLTVNPDYYGKKGFTLNGKVREGVWNMTKEI